MGRKCFGESWEFCVLDRRALLKSGVEYEVVLIDVAELPWSIQKSSGVIIVARKSGTL